MLIDEMTHCCRAKAKAGSKFKYYLLFFAADMTTESLPGKKKHFDGRQSALHASLQPQQMVMVDFL